MTREQFYKSKQWDAFRKLIIVQNTDKDGFIHCSECGKPILRKYDLIIHHKIELNEANVNDANVALNPDNVEVICFRCHNKVHDRFTAGHAPSNTAPRPAVQKKVFVVWGSPAAGKTTFVHEEAGTDDLIVDMDDIWEMVSNGGRYSKPGALKSVVFEIRDKLYDIVKYRSGRWQNAYIITGSPMLGDRERLQQRVGATEMIHIDTDRSECLRRVRAKGLDDEQLQRWIRYIDEYWEKFQEDDTPR